jgi:hypothetical protein
MTHAQAVLVILMHCYRSRPIEALVFPLVAHPLLYLVQEAGEPLGLHFRKRPERRFRESLRTLRTGSNPGPYRVEFVQPANARPT